MGKRLTQPFDQVRFKTDNTTESEDTEQLKLLYTADGNGKWYSHFGKAILAVSYKAIHTFKT